MVFYVLDYVTVYFFIFFIFFPELVFDNVGICVMYIKCKVVLV